MYAAHPILIHASTVAETAEKHFTIYCEVADSNLIIKCKLYIFLYMYIHIFTPKKCPKVLQWRADEWRQLKFEIMDFAMQACKLACPTFSPIFATAVSRCHCSVPILSWYVIMLLEVQKFWHLAFQVSSCPVTAVSVCTECNNQPTAKKITPAVNRSACSLQLSRQYIDKLKVVLHSMALQ